MASTLVRKSIATVKPQGHINAANASEFQNQLTAAVLQLGSSIVLVDMEQVESLDSAGLVALVSALSLAQKHDKRLSLCSVSPAMGIIFELTELDRVFEIFPNPAAFMATID